MVDIEMLQRIRDLKKKGYKKSRAAKEIGIDSKTVKKYWDMTDDDYCEYYEQTQEREKIMNPYREFVVQRLEQYPEITSAIIYDNLRETHKNFEPSARSVRRYVATLREELGIPSGVKVRQYEEVAEVPYIVFREEQRHLKTVPTLSSASTHTSTTAVVRKTNVVNFRQNRYAMPKGTYAPGKKVKIEIDELNNLVSFYDLKTNELIRTHEIAIGVGRYIKDKHATRDRSKYIELKKKIFDGFADIPQAHEFIEKIIQSKERYARDQLSLLNKCKEKYTKEELEVAVNYCMEKTFFSAVDFSDTLEYFTTKVEPEPAIKAIVLPIKYQVVKAKKRDLVAYSSIYDERRCN